MLVFLFCVAMQEMYVEYCFTVMSLSPHCLLRAAQAMNGGLTLLYPSAYYQKEAVDAVWERSESNPALCTKDKSVRVLEIGRSSLSVPLMF